VSNPNDAASAGESQSGRLNLRPRLDVTRSVAALLSRSCAQILGFAQVGTSNVTSAERCGPGVVEDEPAPGSRRWSCNASSVNRTPPQSVKRELQRQQGFACAIADCRNPYLEYHHFDPPWAERKHHEAQGMIALCPEHHRKADGGAYTVAQLRAYKTASAENAGEVRGQFEWLRRDMVLFAGGIFYIECGIAIEALV
jgi:hypothetical protein